MSQSVKVVSELTSLSFRVFDLLGWNPLDDNPRFRDKFYFVTAVGYTALCLIQESIYFVSHLGDEDAFFSLSNLLACMGFVFLALVKIYTVYGNRETVIGIIRRLEFLCLKSAHQHDIEHIVSMSSRMMSIFFIFYMILIWIFNLMPMFVIIYYFVVDGTYHKSLPYFLWYPFDAFQPVVYEICYLGLMWAGFVCAIGILCADLMFCTMVTFLCLQFDALSFSIKKIVNERQPKSSVKQWIADHNELLRMLDDFETTYSPSVLINFIATTVILVMGGFQAYVSLVNVSQ